ncbi:prepilin-type N-terminal cleavage/methylation domain-containing protein [Halanaerobiaceae bacterium Z-7014]|uniref:Prepilin-type N-terminal cleavage/methylation domain-containing protein n=1 Tax=Halonatronomonas betaini TaxID=2778430 RepID=A0A931ASY8_9FIRM|nr:prepilin-type N-terminal cleavage/methylation domain-containing protein [Halonatronomonas betaini]MBF8437584.1 prepilin-type N-terminal cleavage/methylation domain-containing protein [Halonatronomonas betaini]
MKIIRSEEGFTLVEMLLVLVVIGILTSISIPGLAGVRSQADSTAVLLEISGIKNLLELEYMNNNYLYPEDQAAFDKLINETSVNNETSGSYEYEAKKGGKCYLLKSTPDADGYIYKTRGLNTAITRVPGPEQAD